MKPFSLSDLPPALQAQARAQLTAPHGTKPTDTTNRPDQSTPITVQTMRPDGTTTKPRIRQNSAGLNKTEQAFSDHLKNFCDAVERKLLLPQSITLRLANGCRYTPDFITVSTCELLDSAGYPRALHAYEVKGFMRDDAAVKLKVAAALFPWIAFHLVTRAKGTAGGWNIESILS